ncbi:DUF4349 domain-containing protein [Mycobacterium sp.]|uniref:DUF4349 domain-containing protein n=1 Tax=Mycobacterium sp. TaxID=1785 RepID=UPI002CF052A1|nr:DUF4349 domain-containing protein [Mycobacterium sp.]HTQ16156.1 DUF4349 domain-containing protein [Mycobacterium sp.]
MPDLLPGVPLLVTGRYRGAASGSLTLRGTSGDGSDWSATVAGQRGDASAVTAQWARAHLRDLEDRFASASGGNGSSSTQDLAKRIVDTSLRFGVLCRFTAYVAMDDRVVAEGELRHRVMQPVELPAGTPTASGLKASPARRPEDAESGARTVKLRNVVAVAVAVMLLVGIGWFGSLSRDGSSTATRDGVVAANPSATVAGGLPTTRGGVPENTVEAPKAPPFAPPAAPPDNTYKRDIITTGSVRMVVAEPAQAADRLASAVTDVGGRVDSRSEQSRSSSESGSATVALVLRIPADKLDGFLADARKLGTVESMSIGHTDVTSQRVDLDARIEALQTSINRLLDLMRRAGNTADLLAAESSLTQRQAELDSLKARRDTLRDEISYATINVNLSAVPTVTSHGFPGAFEHGWQSLTSAVHGVAMAVGFLIPWIPVLALVALAVVFVRRRSSRRASSATPGAPATDENRRLSEE